MDGELCKICGTLDSSKFIEMNSKKSIEEEHHEESIKNSIQSRFSKETILQKYYDIFHKL